MTTITLPRSPRTAGLMALNVTLVAVLMWRVVHAPLTVAPAALKDVMSAMKGSIVAPIKDAADVTDTYALLTQRPVFHQDRKYIPPPKLDVAAAESPPPDFIVTGYLDIPGRPAKAFLRDRNGTRSITVSVGDKVDDWSVVAIAQKQVSIRQGERMVELGRSGVPHVSALVAPTEVRAATASLAPQTSGPVGAGQIALPREQNGRDKTRQPDLTNRSQAKAVAPVTVVPQGPLHMYSGTAGSDTP